ncbi:MAG: GlsB/YeaQ/YmgE family stress response membrane protein [Chitinophagales bacterium]|nr:GlsB/YeaQ/YmgE family stress response membrane protein [Bacteroidota bacterium]MCB9257161.1 GlsB/YeaQ/YmgE family stress response membrane protein [Chitinophagales bacterium]
MNLIAWTIFGLVAGALAKWIMPGKDGGGWLVTILLGIGGSYVGGYIGRFLGLDAGGNNFSLANMASAIAGALILLWAYRAFQSRK